MPASLTTMSRPSASPSEASPEKNIRPLVLDPLPSVCHESHSIGAKRPALRSPYRKSRGGAANRQQTPAQQEVFSWIEDIIVPALVENFIRMKSSQQEGPDE